MMAKGPTCSIGKMLYVALATIAAFPVRAAPLELPPSSVVLVWAAWCAPCRAEVADFDRLAMAAHPRDTIVWATDYDRRSRAMLTAIPASKLRIVSESLPALYKVLRIKGPVALPLSLMTDDKGRICATIRSGATVPKIEQATRECGASELRP